MFLRNVSAQPNHLSENIVRFTITGAVASVLSVLFLITFCEAGSKNNLSVIRPDQSHPSANIQLKDVNVVTGAGQQKAFRMTSKESALTFSLRCQPDRTNYITLRFWSEDNGSKFTLHNGKGKNVASLDHKSSSNIAPGQWYYTTRMIPRKFTKGKDTLRLRLENAGGAPARNIYQITSHTGARYQPGDHVPKPNVVEPYSYGPYEPPSKDEIDIEEWVQEKKKAADKTAKYIMSRQRYAPDWREKVESGEWDGVLVGGFNIQMKDTLQASKDATMKHIKGRDNGGPMRGVVILAKAYTLEGGKYEGDPEVLDRIAVGLDFMRRAQGKNGGYIDVHGGKWVGGPSRGKGEGALEGRMHRAAVNAFKLTYEDLKEEGLLDERVDDDADPDTPPVPRRKLLKDLFRNSLSYLVKGRGHAPNQELKNVNAQAPLFRALQELGAELKEKKLQEQMNQRIAEITGMKPVGRGTKNPYWVSPKGISMENGGLSLRGYGDGITRDLSRLAEVTEYERVRQRTITTAEAMSQFWYPVYHPDGRIDLREQEAWSRRGTNVRGGPAHVSKWAALNGVSSHIRAYQIRIMGGYEFGPLDPGKARAITGYDPHGWNSSVNILDAGKDAVEYKRLFKTLRETDAPPLPHEKGQPDFAWVDPVSGAVAIKKGNNHVFMTLMTIDGADKKRAGVLEVNPQNQRRAVIEANAPHGLPDDLTLLAYGPFFLAVNASSENTYQVEAPANRGTEQNQVYDMISGRTITPGSDLKLKPGQSVVIFR